MTDEKQQTDTGWQAQVLRLTAFLATPLDPGIVAEIWHLAAGAAPETDDNRPREGIRRQAGPFSDWQLEIVIAQGRVDWILSPRARADAPPALYFASLERAMTPFRAEAKKWLAIGSPSILRLAVGAVLLMPMPDRKAAYKKLNELLSSVQVDPAHASELLYQINWRRLSGVVPNLQLNRLTKWNALVVRVFSFPLSQAVLQSSPTTGEQFCALECDHSTVADRTEAFTTKQADDLLQELCDLVEDNACKGEVPTKV